MFLTWWEISSIHRWYSLMNSGNDRVWVWGMGCGWGDGVGWGWAISANSPIFKLVVAHVQLEAGLSGVAGMATRPFSILHMRMRRRSFLLSSSIFHFRSSNRTVTLNSLFLRLQPFMIWAARWSTISRGFISFPLCGSQTVQLYFEYFRVDLTRMK